MRCESCKRECGSEQDPGVQLQVGGEVLGIVCKQCAERFGAELAAHVPPEEGRRGLERMKRALERKPRRA